MMRKLRIREASIVGKKTLVTEDVSISDVYSELQYYLRYFFLFLFVAHELIWSVTLATFVVLTVLFGSVAAVWVSRSAISFAAIPR